MALNFVKQLKAQIPENSVRYLMHQELTRPQPQRSHYVLHASDLTHGEREFCPRYFALLDVLKVKRPPVREAAAMALVYKHGWMIQSFVCTTLSQAGRGIGDWKCVGCGSMARFCLIPPKCSVCGCPKMQYEEMRFESPSTGASCGIDLLVKTGEPKLRVLEIKSMKEDEFKKLAAPLAEHKQRTNLYLRLIEEAGYGEMIDCQQGTVFYVSKGYGVQDEAIKGWGFGEGGYTPFKEFTVTRNDSETQERFERGAMLKRYRDEALMPLGVCPTSYCKRAKDCEVVHACFSGKYPAQQ